MSTTTDLVYARSLQSSFGAQRIGTDGRMGVHEPGTSAITFTTRSRGSHRVDLHIPPECLQKSGGTVTLDQYRRWEEEA